MMQQTVEREVDDGRIRTIGKCAGCGDPIMESEDYLESAESDTLLHDKAFCVYEYERDARYMIRWAWGK